MPETGASGEHALARMHEVKDHLYDRNMSLNCGNVELRGYEPLTSCMPCLTVPSGGVPLGRVTARQGNGLVRWGLATSAVVWGALSLGLSLATGLVSRSVGPPGCRHRGSSGAAPGFTARLLRT